jgi:hypothetical protein
MSYLDDDDKPKEFVFDLVGRRLEKIHRAREIVYGNSPIFLVDDQEVHDLVVKIRKGERV